MLSDPAEAAAVEEDHVGHVGQLRHGVDREHAGAREDRTGRLGVALLEDAVAGDVEDLMVVEEGGREIDEVDLLVPVVEQLHAVEHRPQDLRHAVGLRVDPGQLGLPGHSTGGHHQRPTVAGTVRVGPAVLALTELAQDRAGALERPGVGRFRCGEEFPRIVRGVGIHDELDGRRGEELGPQRAGHQLVTQCARRPAVAR